MKDRWSAELRQRRGRDTRLVVPTAQKHKSQMHDPRLRGDDSGGKMMKLAKGFLRVTVGALAVIFLLGILGVQQAQAQTETVLYSFHNDGTSPNSPSAPIMDSAGNLYGVARGGAAGHGAVFELVNSSRVYTEKVLYSFAGGPSDGATPFAGLIMDSAGNLFGTTYAGGASGVGTVFELVNSSGSYSEKVLYSFGATSGDASHPAGSLLMDSTGNLYGTASVGALSNCNFGCGAVFELVSASGGYTEKLLYSFTGGSSDGSNPFGSVIMDATANIYGATSGGGASGDGTVFELVNTAGSYTEKVLHHFAGPPGDGRTPNDLLLDSAGNLYGSTQLGGASSNCPNGCGAVFELVNSSGSYAEKLLHSFTGTSEGAYPSGSLIMDAAGKLYGTTGGDPSISLGNGTIFELVNSSGGYAEYVLHLFAGSPGDGASPVGPLLMDSAGNLFGTAGGGAFSDGTVFEITNASKLTVAFTPSILSFGNVLLGTPPTTQSVTVTNIGNANLTLASGAVTHSGANAVDFAITSDGCSGRTLAPGTGTCTVGVTYTPSVLGGETASINFADSAFGNPQTVALSGTGQDFSLNAPNPSQTTSPGNGATFVFFVAPMGGFTGTVALACSGKPPHSTCTVDPASVSSLDGVHPSQATVYVLTSVSGELPPPTPSPPALPPVLLWIMLAGLAVLCLLARFAAKPARIRVLAALSLLIALAFAASCGLGKGGYDPYHSPPTPAGTYTLTISATSGGLTHNLELTLTVQ